MPGPALHLHAIEAVAHAVPDIAAARPVFESLLGFRPDAHGATEHGDPFLRLAPPGASRVAWILLAPGSPRSPLHDFLAGPRGPGLHHLRLAVDAAHATPAAAGPLPVPAQPARPERLPGAQRAAGATGTPAPGPAGPPWLGPPADGDRLVLAEDTGHGIRLELHDGPPARAPAFDDTAAGALGIIAINHVAHAYPDRDALAAWYERILGFTTVWRSPAGREGPSGEFATRVLESPTEQMRIEAIQPTHPGSFIQKFLDERGPAPHHVTVEVAGWDHALAALDRARVPAFGHRDGRTDGVPWKEAFIHPRHTAGVLFQFFWQAEPGVWI